MLKQEIAKVARDRKLRLKWLARQEMRTWAERNAGLNLSEMIEKLSFGRPASPEFIAGLRLEQEEDRKFVDTEMAEEEIQCSICLLFLEKGQAFMASPCNRGHNFHEDCFLEQLRNKNTCPNCRFPFPEADPPPWEGFALRFFYYIRMGLRPSD